MAHHAGSATSEDRGRLLALVAMLSLVDERGQRLFSDEDMPALTEKNFRALERIATAAMRWNGAAPRRWMTWEKVPRTARAPIRLPARLRPRPDRRRSSPRA